MLANIQTEIKVKADVLLDSLPDSLLIGHVWKFNNGKVESMMYNGYGIDINGKVIDLMGTEEMSKVIDEAVQEIKAI